MNVNLIRIPSEYKNKKGELVKTNEYYLECGDGEFIAITPKWTKYQDGKFNGTDFVRLRAYSTLRERK